MSKPKDPQRVEPTPSTSSQPQDALARPRATEAEGLRTYEPPQIVSSKIFHKVMMSTPQPGFPGCDVY